MKTLRFVCFTFATLAVLHAQDPRLANVSTLTHVGTGAEVLTAGFVITGTAPKAVVIRAVGPRLAAAPFNVPDTLSDPTLTVFGPNSSTLVAATNNNWNSADAAAMTAVSAFPLTAGSLDAAIVATLAPGPYTAQVSGVGGAVGTAIVEVYETGSTGGKFINLSTRAQVGGNAGVLTSGFVITPGSGARRLLIRAAGPALTVFGLTGVLANPTLSLVRIGTTTTTVATNDNWGTPVGTGAGSAAVLTSTFTQAGAFAFPAGSNDAALLVDLTAGNYTAQVSGVGNTSGLAIVEVYDVTSAGGASVPFPEVSRPARVYVAVSSPYHPRHGSPLASRYVLYDDGTFALQYSSANYPFFEYRGTYAEADTDIRFNWEASSVAGPWGATASLAGDSLTVRYNVIMQMSDFEDGVYIRRPSN